MEKQISVFGKNLKFLRERQKKAQEIVALGLNFKRGKLSSYENGIARNPPLEDLVTISDYFKMSIDMLVKEDLAVLSESKLAAIETSYEYAQGKNIRIVAITVDEKGKENIEYVPIKIKAGYLAGYNDPEFIKELPKVGLPFLSGGKTRRLFDCEGESMLPLPSKCKILGEYVEDWHHIKDGEMYIVISKEGYAIKKVYRRLENNSLTLKSLNPVFADYEVYLNEVHEVWKFVLYISDTLPEQTINAQELLLKLDEMKDLVKRQVQQSSLYAVASLPKVSK